MSKKLKVGDEVIIKSKNIWEGAVGIVEAIDSDFLYIGVRMTNNNAICYFEDDDLMIAGKAEIEESKIRDGENFSSYTTTSSGPMISGKTPSAHGLIDKETCNDLKFYIGQKVRFKDERMMKREMVVIGYTYHYLVIHKDLDFPGLFDFSEEDCLCAV